MLKIIIFFILIFIIFYIINKYFLKINENFFTYFLPYYDNKKDVLANFYDNNEEKYNYTINKFNYNIFKIGCTKDDLNFTKNLVSNYIKNSNIVDIRVHIYKNIIKNLDDLVNNNINFILTNYIVLTYYHDFLKKNINNVRLLCVLYDLHIYFFTKKKYNVYSLNNIFPNFIVGVLNYSNRAYYLYERLFKDLGYIENIDYKVKIYDDIENLFKGFYNDECNMILICDTFPNNIISKLIDNNIYNDIILLPFDINNEDLFFYKNSFMYKKYIDLNRLSVSYLPKKFGKYEYTKFKPSIPICYINKIILCNKDVDDDTVYYFLKYIYGIKFLDKYDPYFINNFGINNKFYLIKYHDSSIKFFKDNSYISDIDNINCKYLLNVSECTEETLKNNKLL